MKPGIYLFYKGQSMLGTFFEADLLRVYKTSFLKLQRGDIIVFKAAESSDSILDLVHRIALTSDSFLITRGDNNPRNDETLVTERNIVGIVTHYERNGEVHRVWNGRLGMLRARVLHGRLHVVRAVKFISRKPYRLLKKTGIVAKLWHPEIESIRFETQDGTLVKYIHKGRTVANCWIDSNRWWFRRPYDFVVGPKLKN